MQANQPGKLTVTVAGKTLFIEVPSPKAEALLRYLRARGVSTSPPAPFCTGTDSIEIGKGINVKTVQALLDQWS